MKFIGIAKFTMKRWVFNFQHFRKNDRFHVMVNRKHKKTSSEKFEICIFEVASSTGVLKPYSQLHSK